jgi:hypothetical protein
MYRSKLAGTGRDGGRQVPRTGPGRMSQRRRARVQGGGPGRWSRLRCSMEIRRRRRRVRDSPGFLPARACARVACRTAAAGSRRAYRAAAAAGIVQCGRWMGAVRSCDAGTVTGGLIGEKGFDGWI